MATYSSCVNEQNEPMFSVNYIYSHIVREHWGPEILWLGPASKQNTQSFEHYHQNIKTYADMASTKDLYPSILRAVCTTNLFNFILLFILFCSILLLIIIILDVYFNFHL